MRIPSHVRSLIDLFEEKTSDTLFCMLCDNTRCSPDLKKCLSCLKEMKKEKEPIDCVTVYKRYGKDVMLTYSSLLIELQRVKFGLPPYLTFKHSRV